MAQYKIPKINFERLEERIDKLNKKAKKLKCEPITMKEISREFVEKVEGKQIFYVEYINIDIVGQSPSLNGWRFAGTLQHTYETGTVIRSVTGETIPERYCQAKADCEHCNSDRLRKDTYIVYNENTNEYKQVGKSCLKDFVGHTSVNNVARYLEILIELDEMTKEDEGATNFNERYYSITNYLQYVVEVIKKHGYTSKTKAKECEYLQSTSDMAFNYYEMENRPLKAGEERLTITETSIETQKKALQWIREKNTTGIANEYMHNLKTICTSDIVTYRDFGFVASLIATYNKEMEFIQKREDVKKNEKNSQHVGNISDKLNTQVKLNKIILVDTFYGTMFIHLFEDKKGNILKWATNGIKGEEGKKYTLKGTIKGHEEYKEVQQTSLSRCKLVELQ